MPRNLEHVSTVQQRIAAVAQRSPEAALTSLAHYIDLEWLTEAHHRTNKDGSAGVDDVTGKEYTENLHDNLQNLLARLKSGTYKAPPVKRKHIPKGTSGETRPIGVPVFEDKVVQRAVVMLLEPIYEQEIVWIQAQEECPTGSSGSLERNDGCTGRLGLGSRYTQVLRYHRP
jgi:hypothetical protein